ncbi:class A sortase [Pediococcus claussenii]|uniref:Sortase family protein n=1 Tax=Pediococcus claussenii (strain ATCC BAA-344 / DSM 14800 / JCM 18046 / KCTC 3811 / LMG 21948 / P06) TaxID=701521 RepID=G8PAA6_PEDCP|nr:class A sortase [Pediococcus claussenii]AEV94545.1 sortase family protein [Pediococcus claussenii ATCC BAA-344]ANZ69760.1 class A sortase [Pediococcus claussenii]ANZ71577.1 class A sortase [Pediococcus claussenii]KRN19749.1 hypothetical protein IV79_GL001036 [Pediococcus claussenii]
MKAKVKKWSYRVIISLLVLVSLALIFNRQIKNWLISSYNPVVTEKTIATSKNKNASFDFSKVKSLDWETVAKARAKSNQINVIGEVAYPDVKMNLPIAAGVDNTTLALAAGTLKANQKMGEGNYAIAGHHMVNNNILFSPLYWEARVGQKVYLTDLKNVYEYTVNERKFIPATDVSVINDVPNKKMLTMITCDATGAKRLMIRAKYDKKMSNNKAPHNVQKMLASKFNR